MLSHEVFMKKERPRSEKSRRNGQSAPGVEAVRMDRILLAGIAARTRNSDEMSGAGKIPALWQRFYSEGILNKIPDQKSPGEILAAYTDFETDETGEYTIIVGASVNSAPPVSSGLVLKEIPGGKYRKITTERGPIETIVMKAWEKIWADSDLKKNRNYFADLEIYGADATDPEDARIEILLGVR